MTRITYIPLTPPNFHGDIAYATYMANRFNVYSNPEAFGHTVSTDSKEEFSKDSALIRCVTRSQHIDSKPCKNGLPDHMRSCTVGDLLFDQDNDAWYMVRICDFLRLELPPIGQTNPPTGDAQP